MVVQTNTFNISILVHCIKQEFLTIFSAIKEINKIFFDFEKYNFSISSGKTNIRCGATSLALKKSKIAIAINYPLKRWDTLVRFLNYPFALGRKFFLFSDTFLGSQASALYYSLIETCKVMNIDTVQYLTFLFSHAKGLKSEAQWDVMLSWKIDPQEYERLHDIVYSAKPDPNRTETS